ncbi:prepilin-type N-terminal cleavage/methylation domain-containing protein [Luteimonas gilva]|uniref:Prepilin-type N-terminal cleavage/methylation domain-containing protein n=1 Tax=Luteimonas gilva TaxID=2572684 RepID=A0A4U5JTT4_9GAMM|nr:pilin [Luteimonas gilva]TKR29809.1 prepilin-type N-terminal cleavage/methylation domain-containing protein [Luteimonas gilva]
MKNEQGFTLIELMIVVAIIAILAAIALPAYQDYVARSQVSEGMSLASGVKTAVAEYYANYAAWPTTNGAAGVAGSGSITGKYVSSTAVGANGQITVQFQTSSASSKISSSNLTLTPADRGGSIAWTCGGSLASKYRPSSCR